ncbi:MAG TPA: hypothetical protein VEB64_02785 [Azospirillaceae bacterium]|nr:hypothetical protein [Azospirillaceae bacterium]
MKRATVKGFTHNGGRLFRPRHVGIALVAMLATACSDRLLDKGLGFSYLIDAEPAIAAPSSPVRPLSGENQQWPNLASVPSRPRNVMPLSERRSTIERMARDRNASLEAARKLGAGVEPMPVPPPPSLAPALPPRIN